MSGAEQAGPGALVWFRRDLRDYDHAALHAALEAHRAVHCAFVFDTEILDALGSSADRRVTFIWESVRELKASLEARGGGLHVLHGRARDAIPRLARSLGVVAVYANRDYEPLAIARDAEVAERLREAGIDFRTRKDQAIFELDEVRTRSGDAFSVFTPYKRAWLAKLEPRHFAPLEIERLALRLAPARAEPMPALEALRFEQAEPPLPAGMSGGARLWKAFRKRLARYAARRDFPALAGTSRLSVHLRFGTVSIRELVRHARARHSAGAETWLSELIWREFYFAILAARPDVVDHAFRRAYDDLQWENDEAGFRAWCEGRTGYPLVDAAMRELNATGAMHNRLRMVTASFLVKDLGVDWRRGERYFANKLLDYDLAANNGGWQWCASTGCDAQPWFRIFNPVTQSRRFDPEGAYIRRWVPELARVPDKLVHAPWEMAPLEQQAAGCAIGGDYPAPVVRHEEARQRTLARYGAVKAR
ncbi:MAG: DNA photolyase family protein [Betaproteobacteria bacterium]|nr:DNA photolyase family protein [Betaproteobacteria bacterium]